MIVLDTNVISEAMKSEPNLAVRAWPNEQSAETLYFHCLAGGAVVWRCEFHACPEPWSYDAEIRQVICSTSAIESLNARYRWAVRAR